MSNELSRREFMQAAGAAVAGAISGLSFLENPQETTIPTGTFNAGSVSEGGVYSSEGNIVSVNEATGLYPKELIVMDVSEHDDSHSPSRGVVVFHGSDEEVSQKIASDQESFLKLTQGTLYYFYGYPRFDTYEELMQAQRKRERI